MNEREVHTAGGIRVQKISRQQTALIGPREAVEAEMARMKAEQYPVRFDKPQQLHRGADVVTIATLLPIRQVGGTVAPWWTRPGWIVAVLLAASAFIAAVTWLVMVLVSAVAAIATVVVGAAVAAAIVYALVSAAGGSKYTQVMNIGK